LDKYQYGRQGEEAGSAFSVLSAFQSVSDIGSAKVE